MADRKRRAAHRADREGAVTARERLTAPPESMELVAADTDLGEPLWKVDDGEDTHS